jgi:hypothetical protein
VRVHDDVGADSLIVERHVFLRDDEAANSLLTVTGRELVAEFGTTGLANENLDKGRVGVGIGEEDLVDVTRNRTAVRHAGVLPRACCRRCRSGARSVGAELVVVSVRRRLLVDIDLTRVALLADVSESVEVEDTVAVHDLAIFALRRVGETVVAFRGKRRKKVSLEERGRKVEGNNAQSVRVTLQHRHILAEDLATTEAAIKRRPVEDERVLDIVTGVGHDSDGRVLTGRKLVVTDELDRPRPAHGSLRVDHEVEEGVDAVELVVSDGTDRLFTHSALVGVTRGLVVVRVRDETGDGAEEGEGFDLEVSRFGLELVLVERDVGVVLLVDVEVLDETLAEEVVEGHDLVAEHLREDGCGGKVSFVSLLHPTSLLRPSSIKGRTATHLHMRLLNLTLPPLHNNHRPTNPPSITRDMNRLLLKVDVDADELVDPPRSTKLTEGADETGTATGQAEDVTVEVDDEVAFGVDLGTVEDVDVCREGKPEKRGEKRGEEQVSTRKRRRKRGRKKRTFNTNKEANVPNRILLNIRRNMRHQRQVLHQSTRLSFRRITRTQHSPLTRLQRSRSTDLPRLLELGRDTGHHSQRRDETQPRKDVSDPRPLHLETLEGPITGRDGADETLSDAVTM